jgi:P4 family phage/plasmid primase-like protien
MDKNQKIVREFHDFIEQYRVNRTPGTPCVFTHTSLGNPAGTFNIPEDKTHEFFKFYRKALRAGVGLHLTEKHKPQGPIVIDVDIKYQVPKDEPRKRRYTRDHIKHVCKVYNYYINEFYEANDDQFHAYVMEKEAPTFVSEDGEMETYKDGFHIIYPNICTKPIVQHIMRLGTISEFTKHKRFEDLAPINPLSDIFDKAVIERNGWMMYGSSKPNGKKYDVTCVLDRDLEEMDIDEDDKWDLINDLSIRKFDASQLDSYRGELNEEKIDSIYDSLVPKNEKRRLRGTEDELRVAQVLVGMLKKERADDYGKWIELGFCLHNIDDELLDLWIDFSKKSSKYKDGECQRLWSGFRDDGLTIRSLHRWAREDDPATYGDFMLAELGPIIQQGIDGTSYSVAKAFFELNKYQYVVASVAHRTWYYFDGVRWREMEGAYRIINQLNEDMVNQYIKLSGSYGAKATALTGEEKDSMLKKQTACQKLICKLRDSGFKEKVVKELITLYYDPTYLEKLDENRHLICFSNGVLDVNTMMFRDGRPEDYISLSTNICYQSYNKNDKTTQDVENFFREIQPEDDMREYVMRFLSSCIAGHAPDEKIHIWTGSGCHAYDTDIMMHDGTIKKVQDVVVGDLLMGDDSTPRTVQQLFRGHSDMFRIVPKKGDSFVVNGDHILSLASTNTMSYVWSEKEHRFKLRWHEYDRNKMTIATKCKNFPVRHDDKLLYKKSVTYYDTKEQAIEAVHTHMAEAKTALKKGDVVDVSVKEFLRIRNSVGSRNFYLFKRPTEFPHKEVSLDPYEVGQDLGRGIMDAMPVDYKVNSPEVQRGLLDGLVDVCGLYNKGSRQFELSLPSKKLVHDVLFVARSLGMPCHVVGSTHVVIHTRPCDMVTNFDIVPCGQDNFYGFELDGNHRYLMGDHTVTHNSNGKSLLVNLMMLAMGDYATTLSIALLTQKRAASNAATPELADTKGKRFAVFQEPDNNDHINVGHMKELTGNDKIKARKLFKEPIEFYPQFKPVLTCNKLPVIPSNDGGTWRRIRVSPFEMKFVDNPKESYERQVNKRLKEILPFWKEAFMSVLVEAYKRYKAEGLVEPEKVLAQTKHYEKNSDMYGEFVWGLIGPGAPEDQINLGDLYREFTHWFKANRSDKCTVNRNDLKWEVEEKLKKRFVNDRINGFKVVAYVSADGSFIRHDASELEQ